MMKKTFGEKRFAMRKPTVRLLGILILMPFAIPLGVKLTRTVDLLVGGRGESPSFVSVLLLTAVLAVIAQGICQLIHLVGRLICAEYAGYRPAEIRVFNLTWKITDESVKFRFLRGLQSGCSSSVIPPETEPGKNKLLLLMGGPLAVDFFVGVILLVLASEFSYVPILSAIAYIVAMFCFFSVITSGLPIPFLYGVNVGYYLLELARHHKAAHMAWVAQMIAEAYRKNVLIKHMPEEWFSVPTAAEMKNLHLAHIGALACSRMVDECRFAEADRLAELLLQVGNLREHNRKFLVMHRIRCELLSENRPEAVEHLLTRDMKKWLEKAAKLNPNIHATLYALALLHEKDTEKAQRIADEITQQTVDTDSNVNTIEARDFMEYVNRIA